jgi:hypothetical protein
MDLKQYAGSEIVVQFKREERWFVWQAPPKQTKASLPELVRAPDENGNSVPIPMPFIQGKVTPEGDLIVNTGSGGKLTVTLAEETIASVTRIFELATIEERSNLIVPGN